jgi:ABC-type transport system involved in cytochrome bd biosynthesis fused ATPase/permease subunit
MRRKVRVYAIWLTTVPDWVCSLKREPDVQTITKIAFEHATFRWNSGGPAESGKAEPAVAPISSDSEDTADAVAAPTVFNLADLTVDFPIGKLTVVTGPTGAGKTAVLTALLGEMELVEGQSWLPKQVTRVDKETGLRNSIAYAAQTPWLQQKSIKDNILFGDQFDAKRYEATLEACAL